MSSREAIFSTDELQLLEPDFDQTEPQAELFSPNSRHRADGR